MNIGDVLLQLNVPFMPPGSHHHVREGWYGVDCPRCSPNSQRWRLGFQTEGKGARCWQCGTMSVKDTLREIANVPQNRVKELLSGLHAYRKRTEERPRGTLHVPKGVGRLRGPHKRYLQSRGFDPDEIAEVWKVRGTGMQSRLPWSLFIPAYVNGEMVSWTTRSLNNEGRRYVSADRNEEKVPLKSTLYGEDGAEHAIVVVEGPLDVWAVGAGAVATYGTAYTQGQVLRMSRYPVRVVCYDNEPGAQRQAVRLCNDLSAFPGKTFRVVLSGKDAASCGREEIKELRRRFLK